MSSRDLSVSVVVVVVMEEGEEAVRERKDVGEAVGQRNLHEGHRLEHLQVPA